MSVSQRTYAMWQTAKFQVCSPPTFLATLLTVLKGNIKEKFAHSLSRSISINGPELVLSWIEPVHV